MKTYLYTLIAAAAVISSSQTSRANTELWIGNPGISASTNWSDNANWSNLTGGGTPGPAGNDVIFGDGGGINGAGIISSVVDNSSLNTASLTFTNQSHSPNLLFHTVLIPSGVGLINTNALIVGVNNPLNGYLTTVGMTGGGVFVQRGANMTVKNIGSTSSSGALATLDMSSLTNFVYTNTAGTITVGSAAAGSEARGGGILSLASTSNHITAGTIALALGTGNGGSTLNAINLGAGTNVINVSTINVSAGKINTARITFGASTGGLRLRGTGGTDTDRSSITLGSRGSTGTGSILGSLLFNDHPIDIKASTIIIGRSTANQGGQATAGNFEFNSGVMDATTINLAVCSGNAGALANGTMTVGTGGSLVVSNISLVNQTAGIAVGNLNIGGVVNSGDITKSTVAGTGNVTITNGTLTMSSGKVLGTPAIPVDTVSLTTATLNLTILNNLTNIVATTLDVVDSANTVNIVALPSLNGFPSFLPLATYTSYPNVGNINLGTLPSGFSGYVSNDVSTATVWLVITNGPFVSKTVQWGGAFSGVWDTAALNWTNAGAAVSYNNGDFVIFADGAKTNNVTITAARTPSSLLISNTSPNYTFTGAGSIGGIITLIKDGTGSLTMSQSGGDNFGGGIGVLNGTLILDNANSAITGGLTVSGGATAQIGNNSANGVLPAGTIVIDGLLIFNRTADSTVATAITGAGALTKSGSAKLTLTGTNTYTGNTTVNNGTLALTGIGTISNSAQVTVTGAGLDITGAASQPVFQAVSFNNATLSVAMPNVNPAATVSSLSMSGANIINFSSLPPVASYPATVTIVQSATPITGFNMTVGSFPAASPSYAGNVSLSGDQLSIRLTLTAGPIGVRPAVFWSGADVPNLNTNWSDGLNWLLQGAPGVTDNVVFNSTATVGSSAITTPGGGTAALDPSVYNNFVDANFNIASLSYTNVGGTFHNTRLNNGRTLNVTNAFSVGAIDAGGTATSENVSISGSATVTINNTNSNFQVWLGSQNVGHQATLDMSALNNFNATVSRVTVGASAVNNAVNRPSGTLYLAKTNIINAGFQTTTIEVGTATGNAGIVVGDCNQNAGPASFLNLGIMNVIATDTIGIARQKTQGTIRFNPTYANVAPYPVLNLMGSTAARVSVFDVASGVGNTGTTTGTGTADFSGGTVNAMVDTLNVGRASAPTSGTGGGTTTGILTYDVGTINANSVNIGLQPAATHTAKVGVGTVNVNTNATIGGGGAKLVVNGNLSLAVNIGGSGTAGTLNINGGTVLANNIVAGTGSGNSTISLADGLLVVTNTAGTPGAPLSSLNLTGGTLQLNVDGAVGASVVATSITPAGTTAVKIGAVANVTTGVTYPLMSYQGADPFGSLTLVSLPAGAVGTLVDDTANSAIGINFTAVPAVPPRIGDISFNGGSMTFSGSNGTPNAAYVVIATTNIALPRTSWTRVVTNNFDGTGHFNYTAPIDPTKPIRFFSILVP